MNDAGAQNTSKVLALARLLLIYEMDGPHADAPDRAGSRHYPVIPPETLNAWLASPHAGDCTGLPAPCNRCHAEQALHEAQWLIDHTVEA